MQTLVSAFEDPSKARRAVERLVADGFPREDIHLQEAPQSKRERSSDEDADDQEVAERAIASPEREVAVGKDAIESLGHFFVSLFGQDHPHRQTYADAVMGGRSLVIVDAESDERAEHAAAVLHQAGAAKVSDEVGSFKADRPGVHAIDRTSQLPLRELVAMSQYEGANHS